MKKKNKIKKDEIRIRNPFHDPLVTELIEDPPLYREMFSERILVGETLQVFQPANVVLLGPQGSGKSMILNLVRYSVLSEWISPQGIPPAPLKHLEPFFGISVNLVRANFHIFGRRSISRIIKNSEGDRALDTICAADFLNHYLFREFLKGIEYILGHEANQLGTWLGIRKEKLKKDDIASKIATWDSWFGYYSDCHSLDDLVRKCEQRLSTWRSFLNANIDNIPRDIWESKSTLGDPLHAMGNLLNDISSRSGQLPLFVVIDQYEVLPELNPTHGTTLQQLVNTLIKARDPVVFYKIGARTHDWGNELRIWGAESRIEVQRDYIIINLADLLMRNEDGKGWLFPAFAEDVTYKRIKIEGHYRISRKRIKEIFGSWNPEKESCDYFRNELRKFDVIKNVSDEVKQRIKSICGPDSSPLNLRLAAAWALQKQQKGIAKHHILRELRDYPWERPWWRKERIGIALLQVASFANQKKLYCGWKTILYLSGANISAFLLLCAEIWDTATKMDFHPLKKYPLPPNVQSEAIYMASEKWHIRDQNEQIGGRQRYEVLNRLGSAIHDALIRNLAISNPGHSGFSLPETDLWKGEKGEKVAKFLQNGVNWAVFEERPHTSKIKEDVPRRKYYLHPLLSPVFAIPYIRVKEPLYVTIEEVYKWIFGGDKVKFEKAKPVQAIDRKDTSQQLRLKLEE